MEAIILNTDFEQVGIVDVYKSFIWTDRYQESGDFEVYAPVESAPMRYLKQDYYLWNRNSEHAMIIEAVNIESDAENGAYVIVRGHSLECLLYRRIVWNKVTITEGTKLQNGLEILFNQNIIKPALSTRAIPNFIFEYSDDPKITSLVFDEETDYFGDNMYTVVQNKCVEHEIGFKVTLTDDNKFKFKLYAGADRSYDQEANPYVVFSPEHGNLLNSNYIESVESWKNVTLVAGDEEGSGTSATRVTRVVSINDPEATTGISRREVYTKASGIKSTSEHYTTHLKQKGIDTLMENSRVKAFEGEQDLNHRMYTYGEDYFMGDIVQVENEYGQEGRSYISEFIISCDESGTTMYPTFKSILKGEYEA